MVAAPSLPQRKEKHMATEAPKYRLNHTSYIDDRMYLAGAEGPFDKETGEPRPVYYVDTNSKHTPGPHWEPVNEAAKARMKECGVEYTGFVPDSMDKLVDQLEEAKKHAQAETNRQIGRGVAEAMIEAGAVTAKPAKNKAPAAEPAEI